MREETVSSGRSSANNSYYTADPTRRMGESPVRASSLCCQFTDFTFHVKGGINGGLWQHSFGIRALIVLVLAARALYRPQINMIVL